MSLNRKVTAPLGSSVIGWPPRGHGPPTRHPARRPAWAKARPPQGRAGSLRPTGWSREEEEKGEKVAPVVGTATIPVAITVTVNLVADHLLGLFSGFCAAAIFPLDGHH